MQWSVNETTLMPWAVLQGAVADTPRRLAHAENPPLHVLAPAGPKDAQAAIVNLHVLRG